MKTSKNLLIGVGVFLLLLLITWGICETAGSDYYNYKGYVVDIVEENGDTDFLPGVMVDILDYEDTNEKMIAEYIKNQLEEDFSRDQISLKEYMDPFTGKPVK